MEIQKKSVFSLVKERREKGFIIITVFICRIAPYGQVLMLPSGCQCVLVTDDDFALSVEVN